MLGEALTFKFIGLHGKRCKLESSYVPVHDSNCFYFKFQGLKFALAIATIASLPGNTVKILKIGTPEIITTIVLQLEQLDFTVQYCVQKMQTE